MGQGGYQFLTRLIEQTFAPQALLELLERELQRAQAAWDSGAIAERDLRRAQDERESARLAYEHAKQTADLERESLDLDLRARRQDREYDVDHRGDRFYIRVNDTGRNFA